MEDVETWQNKPITRKKNNIDGNSKKTQKNPAECWSSKGVKNEMSEENAELSSLAYNDY